jgi:hypothetical protein
MKARHLPIKGRVERGDAYVAATRAEHTNNVVVRTRAERWFTADFSN